MKPSVLRSGKALCLYLALCFCLLCTCAGADSFNGYTSSVITVGSSVSFGHYEQDGSWQNGSEPIVWDVLDIDGDSALLISRKLLDCVQYHSRETAVAWGNSDIRWWLNSSFYQSAFNESEKSCIIQSLVSGTLDYVFLPNRNQVLSYGLCDTGCDTTPYAAGRGVQIGQSTGKGCWWVRMDVTHANGNAQFVGTRGNVYDTNRVTIGNNGVRPCIVASVYALQSGGIPEAAQRLCRSRIRDTMSPEPRSRSWRHAADRPRTMTKPIPTISVSAHRFGCFVTRSPAARPGLKWNSNTAENGCAPGRARNALTVPTLCISAGITMSRIRDMSTGKRRDGSGRDRNTASCTRRLLQAPEWIFSHPEAAGI